MAVSLLADSPERSPATARSPEVFDAEGAPPLAADRRALMGRHTAPVPVQPPQPAERAGRHTAPIPVQAPPAAAVGGAGAGRHTVAVPVQQSTRPLLPTGSAGVSIAHAAAPAAPVRPVAAAPTSMAPRAARPRVAGAPGPTAAPPVATAPAPAVARPLLPVPPRTTPQPAPFAPRQARGTVAALPATGPVPRIAAPSLSTAPVPVVARPDRRRPVGRLVAVVAGLVVAGSIAAQIGPQRSLAEPIPATTTSTDGAATDAAALRTAAASPAATTAVPAATAASPAPSVSGTGPSTAVASSAGPTLSFGPIPTGPAPDPSSAGPSADASPAPDDSDEPSAKPSRSSASPTRSAEPSSTPSDQPSRSASQTPSASAPSTPSETPTSAPDPTTEAPSGDAATVRSLRAAASDADARNLDLGTGTWRFDDFRADLLGVDLSGNLTGAGSGRTTIAMTARSSSKRSSVPKKDWTTNQLSLVKVSGAKEISGFTLRGTEQGHLYNGLRLSKASGMKVHDVKVVSVPGNDDIPPGETFGINDFHTDGSRYSDVEVDGNGIASANFGTNSSSDTTITDSWFHDSGHANGVTFWQTRNVTVRDTRSTGNYDTGFNFERVSGDVLLDHVTMKGNRLAHIRINSDKGSADYRIVDPVFDGPKLKILMTPRYMGHDNVQKRSDVTVIIDGVDRTDDVVQWVNHF